MPIVPRVVISSVDALCQTSPSPIRTKDLFGITLPNGTPLILFTTTFAKPPMAGEETSPVMSKYLSRVASDAASITPKPNKLPTVAVFVIKLSLNSAGLVNMEGTLTASVTDRPVASSPRTLGRPTASLAFWAPSLSDLKIPLKALATIPEIPLLPAPPKASRPDVTPAPKNLKPAIAAKIRQSVRPSRASLLSTITSFRLS